MPAQRGVEAGDGGEIGGAGFQAGGHLLRLVGQIALPAGAAHEDRLQFDAVGDIQPGDTDRATQAFMRGEGDDIGMKIARAHWHVPHRLRGIEQRDGPGALRAGEERRDIVQMAGHVGRMSERHQRGPLREGALKGVDIQLIALIQPDDGQSQIVTPFQQMAQRAQHRVMLGH